MRQFHRSTIAVLAGLGTLAIAVAPGFAAGGHQGARDAGPVQGTTAQVQLAHMGGGGAGGAQGQGSHGMMGRGYSPGHGARPGYGMGSGCGMEPGMMGPGMTGSGKGGQGMMGPGMGGQGMMGPNMMGRGFGSGQGFGGQVVPSRDLATDDVRHFLEHRIEMHGNKRLKVGEVTETDDDTITADIVTQDGSVAQRFKVDRHTGQMQQAE